MFSFSLSFISAFIIQNGAKLSGVKREREKIEKDKK
jgi:hypothetical protein